MLEIMSIVAVVAMVVLLSTIKHLRAVSHDMWVKMVNMEFEIDRLRGLVGRSTVQMGCACAFEPAGYMSDGAKYVDYLTERMIYDLAMKMTQELTCHMRPLVLQGLERSRGLQFAGEMHFRMPMVRADFEQVTCYVVSRMPMVRADFEQVTCYVVSRMPGMEPIEIVSERDYQRKAWEEQREVEHFKGILDSLHVDTKTILQNLES